IRGEDAGRQVRGGASVGKRVTGRIRKPEAIALGKQAKQAGSTGPGIFAASCPKWKTRHGGGSLAQIGTMGKYVA
ncbi:hypothetical protein, partial [Mesorhizobium norvegicum]